MMKKILIVTLIMLSANIAFSQTSPDEDQLGAWYMYFFNKSFKESRFGIQGDYQFRFWNMGSDLEQILLRTGATYRPKNTEIQFTLGYAFISTGTFGESDETFSENRIYQELLMPQKVGNRFLFMHRFRYEQRWVDEQDFRTRYRYNLFLNIPFNNTKLEHKTVYLALYNELFINGQRDIGEGREVELFDRNRTYIGMGYGLLKNMRVQVGWMKQTTDAWSKGQSQFSLHHNF